MRRQITRAMGGLVLGTVLASAVAGSAFAATPKTSWEVVAGNFASRASATKYAATLASHGLKGFGVEAERTGTKGHFQVEIGYSTKAAAMAELAKLKAAHNRGGIETDTGTV